MADTIRHPHSALSESELREALQRAVYLARRGPNNTPNPQVGCVIIDELGRIVAEGWHQGAGTPHAETAALSTLPLELQFPQEIKKLTAVVTLEPCNHTGRTGPCAQALAAAGIGAVVYGAADPTELASGGAQALAAAGVQVSLMADQGCAELLAAWQQRTGAGGGAPAAATTGADLQAAAGAAPIGAAGVAPVHAATSAAELPGARPYVILKWAQSLDGRAAAQDGSSQWITGPESRADVHRRRASCELIACGTGTLLADDPSLTARGPAGDLLVPAAQQPLPVVFGSREIPETAALRQHPALAAKGLTAPLQLPGHNLPAALQQLAAAGYRSLFVEGGPTLIAAFLRAGLYDELLVYIAPTLLGGDSLAVGDIGVESITAAKRFTEVQYTQLGADQLVRMVRGSADPHPTTVKSHPTPHSRAES